MTKKSRLKVKHLRLAALCLFSVGATASQAQLAWIIHEMPTTSGGQSSGARAINENNVVAGFVRNSSGRTGAAIYDMTTLNPFGLSQTNFTDAFDINDLGQVTGTAIPISTNRAFFYDGTYQLLPGLNGNPGAHSWGNAINNAGQIVGMSTDNANRRRPTMFSVSGATDLGTFGGDDGEATDIHDDGMITGNAAEPGGVREAFVLSGSGMIGIDPFSTQNSEGSDFSPSGNYVLGRRTGPASPVGLLYNGTSTALILPPPGESGFITGGVLDDGTVAFQTNSDKIFLHKDGIYTNVSAVASDPTGRAWELSTLRDFNSNYWLVGQGRVEIAPGQWVQRGFILEPVPEPATIAVLGLGLVALLRRRRM